MSEAEAIAARTGELVSLPRAWHRINEMLDDDRYGTADMAPVIAADPGLTARLLKLVNSPFYGLPRRVDSVAMAASVLGTRALHNLILTTSVASAFRDIDTRLVDVADFWHHSIYCGLVARLLAHEMEFGDAEQAFIGGLLHDVGKLALYHERPREASRILQELAASDPAHPVTFRELEQRYLGFDHAAIGAALLAQWRLPPVYHDIAAYHHAPGEALGSHDEVALIHVANALAKKIEAGHVVALDEQGLPLLSPRAAERVPLDAALVERLSIEADVNAIEVYGTLFGG